MGIPSTSYDHPCGGKNVESYSRFRTQLEGCAGTLRQLQFGYQMSPLVRRHQIPNGIETHQTGLVAHRELVWKKVLGNLRLTTRHHIVSTNPHHFPHGLGGAVMWTFGVGTWIAGTAAEVIAGTVVLVALKLTLNFFSMIPFSLVPSN